MTHSTDPSTKDVAWSLPRATADCPYYGARCDGREHEQHLLWARGNETAIRETWSRPAFGRAAA